MKMKTCSIPFTILAGFAALIAAGPQARPKAPPLADAEPKLVPGLTLTIENASGRDVRDSRLAALTVPEGTPPSPFLDPGPFKATWEGFARVDLGTDCIFSAEGNGKLTVEINDKPVLRAGGRFSASTKGKEVLLRKGRNRFVVKYESPAKGDAFVRVFWESTDWAHEPVHPREISHDANAKTLRERRRLREGRELVALRRCTRCHAHEAKGMPELELDSPNLSDAGTRLHTEWMARWILNPRSIRPEATMPVLPEMTSKDAADLAAFLSLQGKPGEAREADPKIARAGGQLFAELRCIGCHTLPDRKDAKDRIPLYLAKAKWRPAALRAFLKEPDRHYAWIEMPNFQLTDAEAEKLAAFLLSRKQRELPKDGSPPVGDPEQGKARFLSFGCLNCHKLGDLKKTPAATPFAAIPAAAWTRGCLEEKPSKAPDFGLAKEQREAIQAFASTDLSSLGREDAPEFVGRQLKALRCIACHKRDHDYDLWTDVQEEAAHLLPKKKVVESEFFEPDPAEPWFPSLTWIGDKLKPEWTEAFIAGRIENRLRPYLGNLRMPVFKSRAAILARGFAMEHGCPTKSPEDEALTPELSEIGRKLSGPSGGYDCIACHAIGPKKATKVFEGPGPNFKWVRGRIRKDYFVRWVNEPLRVEPRTKMPQFFKQGRSQLTEVFDGDAKKQIDAMWQYILQGEKINPPD